jgi:hypothetical protein
VAVECLAGAVPKERPLAPGEIEGGVEDRGKAVESLLPLVSGLVGAWELVQDDGQRPEVGHRVMGGEGEEGRRTGPVERGPEEWARGEVEGPVGLLLQMAAPRFFVVSWEIEQPEWLRAREEGAELSLSLLEASPERRVPFGEEP